LPRLHDPTIVYARRTTLTSTIPKTTAVDPKMSRLLLVRTLTTTKVGNNIWGRSPKMSINMKNTLTKILHGM
jgi:hypothetical protein